MRQYDVVGIIPRFRSGYLPLIRPRSHYAERILKRRFHSENASSVFRPHFAERILKRRFHSESASSVFRPHFAGRILKRRFHSENASNVFRPHHAGENVKWKRNNHRSFWICVIGKLGQRKKKSHDHRDYIVFEKLRFQNVSRPHKTKSRRFQIPPVWRAFSKSSVSVAD